MNSDKKYTPTEKFIEIAGIKKLEEQKEYAKRLEKELSAQNKGQLNYYLERLSAIWQQPPSFDFTPKEITKEDPIYKVLTIEEQISPIYHHMLLQRLEHIRQLSFSYLLWPNAHHTRLSHSLGVCRNVEHILEIILGKNQFYSSTGKKEIELGKKMNDNVLLGKVVGLLHDIGHCPYAHTLDRPLGYEIYEYPYTDKFLSVSYVKEYLEDTIEICECEISSEEIISILGHAEEFEVEIHRLIADIIDSQLDADRMDYLARDTFHTGLVQGMINIDVIIGGAVAYVDKTDKVSLAFKESVLSHIKQFIEARAKMYTVCYELPQKVAAEAMLTKAVTLFLQQKDLKWIDIKLLTDAQLGNAIFLFSNPSDPSYILMKDLLQGNLYREIFSFPFSAESKSSDFKILEDSWSSSHIKDMDKIIEFKNLVSAWEEILARASGLPSEEFYKVLLYVPPPESRHRGTANILTKEKNGYTTKDVWEYPYIKEILEAIQKEREKLRVFIHPKLSSLQEEAIRKKAEEKCIP